MNIKALNKDLSRNYEILEKFEAGLILQGPEVKSVKRNLLNLKGSYVRIEANQALLIGAHISAYQPARGAQTNYNPTRARKLLLNKKEINQLRAKLAQKGLTVAPTKVYTTNGLVKVEVALLKGLKKHDQRAKLKKRAIDRDVARELKKNTSQ